MDHSSVTNPCSTWEFITASGVAWPISRYIGKFEINLYIHTAFCGGGGDDFD